MEQRIAADLLATLAHEGRLAVFRLLVRRMPDGVRPTGIAAALDLRPNTLSQYLGALERAGLVYSERHGKAVLYRAVLPRMGALVDYLIADCCRGRPDLCVNEVSQPFVSTEIHAMSDRKLNVLFICTGNAARSIFAEALLRDLGGARFNVFSAGTTPAPHLNPFAVELLRRQGHDIAGLRAKTTAEFQGPGAQVMDFVFTVCDTAANEDCPPWPGQPITAHWGLPDPVKVTGTDAERSLAFAQTYAAMRRRIEAFASLPLARLDALSLQRRLDEIGGTDV